MKTNLRGTLFCGLVMLFAANTTQGQVSGNPRIKKMPGAQPGIQKSSSILSKDLISLYESKNPGARRAAGAGPGNGMNNLIQVKGDRVMLDVTFKGDEQKARAELRKLGFEIKAVYGRMISGSVPVTTLREMESATSLKFVRPAYKPLRMSGSMHNQLMTSDARAAVKTTQVISQGDTAQRSYIARKKYKVNGKGVKIGILSDSYNSLGTAGAGVSGGELPGPGNPLNYRKSVEVLEDFEGGTDEGRAMAEIIHDVAPGAALAFTTAQNGQAAFAKGIENLASAGCKVITDDVIYFAEPFYQDGIIAQAVDKVKRKGVAYFSAAGNRSVRSYESDYRASNFAPFGIDAGTAHNFSKPGDAPLYFQPIFIPTGGTFIASFQYDQPFYSSGGDSADSDFDVYLVNDTGAVVALGGSDNVASGDPVEVFGYENPDSLNNTFYLAILKYSGPDPTRLKYILYGDGQFYRTAPAIPGVLAPTIVGHAKAEGAIATGAAFYLETPAYGLVDTPLIEPFSSRGGVASYFTPRGTRIAPVYRFKPEIVAPDGVNTSFFDPFGGGDIAEDTDTYPNFFGTSAAAPHAAGVAALMIEAQKLKTITPNQIRGELSSHTFDMDNPDTQGFDKWFDFASGNGLINAEGAVGAVKFPAVYIKDLKPESVCSEDPSKVRKWKVTNPNPFELKAHWFLAGFNQSGRFTVSPKSQYLFSTNTAYYANKKVPNIVIVDWEDNFGFTRFKIIKSISVKCGDLTIASASELDGDNEIVPDKPVIAETYPNPVVNGFKLYLSLPGTANAQIELMSIDGRKIMNRTVAAEGVTDIETSGYKAGVYILQVRQGSFNKTIKIVKQ